MAILYIISHNPSHNPLKQKKWGIHNYQKIIIRYTTPSKKKGYTQLPKNL